MRRGPVKVRGDAKAVDVRTGPRFDEDRLPDAADGGVPTPLFADRLLVIVHGIFHAQHQQPCAPAIVAGQRVGQIELERDIPPFVASEIDAIAPAIGKEARGVPSLRDTTGAF